MKLQSKVDNKGEIIVLKLIELEIKKFKLQKYIPRLIVCQVAVFLIIMFNDRSVDNTFSSFLMLLESAVESFFLIFSAVISSKIIIGEYKSKTIMNMFMYPVSRKKIMLSKFAIVWMFTFTATILTEVFVEALVIIIKPSFYSWTTKVDLQLSLNTLGYELILSIMVAFMSFIPLIFAMKKKSNATVIVCSIILFSASNSINQILPKALVYNADIIKHCAFAVAGIAALFLMLSRVEKSDVLN